MKELENHVVIIGWDGVARNVAQQLVNAGKKVVIVSNNERDRRLSKIKGVSGVVRIMEDNQ